MKYFPAISVIIPLYNAKSYIAECLDSILAQTFKDFEVIIVDDCSTDNSPAIVENYLEKFDGRLSFYHMKKNSGSGAMPRNKGMRFSRGEYLAFMDSDDKITPTALEQLYTLAKDYDADVVYCQKHYTMNAAGVVTQIKIDSKNIESVDNPIFETQDLKKRVEKILQEKYRVPPWRKVIRRSLIFEYDLFFPHCKISEDDIWTYGLIFYAKKFLLVPNATYIYRLSEDSIKLTPKTHKEKIAFWLNPVLLGIKSLDNFMSEHEFFQDNPQYRYALLEKFLNVRFSLILSPTSQLQSFAVYETIKQTFGQNLGEHEVLISVLCSTLNALQKKYMISYKKFDDYVAQTQQQIKDLEKINRENLNYILELENFIMKMNRKG